MVKGDMMMSINQSIDCSDDSFPPEASPKGVAMEDRSPPLPIHALPSCPLQPISPHSPLIHIHLHPIFLSSKWPSPPIRTLNTTQIHLLYKFFISHPFNMAKPIPCPLMPHLSYTLSMLTPSHLFTPHAPLR